MNNEAYANYYIPMTDKAFEEIKAESIKLWETYDNEFGYVDEKRGRIEDLENTQDNGLYMIAMFDVVNVYKLLMTLSEDTIKQLSDKRIPDEISRYHDINGTKND